MSEKLPFSDDLRQHDRARYVATLFAPQEKRADLIILHVFDLTIARIPLLITEPMNGEIRLQWWREVVDGSRAGEAVGNPLGAALLDVIARNRLPLSAFERYFDARAFEFYHDAFPDRHALEEWAGATRGAMFQLSAIILDPVSAQTAADASGHCGVALAIADILVNLPRTRSRNQCFLPLDLLSACGLDRDSLVEGKDHFALKNATDALSGLGLEHDSKARTAIKTLPTLLKPAHLTFAPARSLLRKSLKSGVHPSFESPRVSSLVGFLSILRLVL